MFDGIAVSGSTEGRMIEYVAHLHEHFVEPVEFVDAHYCAPKLPGSGAEMLPASIAAYRREPGAPRHAAEPAVAR
jgi:L-fuconate dehydratase